MIKNHREVFKLSCDIFSFGILTNTIHKAVFWDKKVQKPKDQLFINIEYIKLFKSQSPAKNAYSQS